MEFQWRDEVPGGLIRMAVGRCLIATMDAGRWTELAALTGCLEEVEQHPRLLRSLYFGDDDYDSCATRFVPTLLGEPPFGVEGRHEMPNLDTVADYLGLAEWLAEHDPKLCRRLFAVDEGLAPDGALISSMEGAARRLDVAEMNRQMERIRRDFATDPEALVGAVKELVETVCRTILGTTGDTDRVDLPALVSRTQEHLGIRPEQVRLEGGDVTAANAMKRMTGGLTSILTGLGELRNARGTGHGRSGAPLIDDAMARMAASLGLSATVYLCEVHALRMGVPREVAVEAADGSRFAAGDLVRSDTHGEGQVIEVRNLTDEQVGDAAVTVDFGPEVGTKMLLVPFANLLKVF